MPSSGMRSDGDWDEAEESDDLSDFSAVVDVLAASVVDAALDSSALVAAVVDAVWDSSELVASLSEVSAVAAFWLVSCEAASVLVLSGASVGKEISDVASDASVGCSVDVVVYT